MPDVFKRENICFENLKKKKTANNNKINKENSKNIYFNNFYSELEELKKIGQMSRTKEKVLFNPSDLFLFFYCSSTFIRFVFL
ncbi:hypothetical protein Mgra_00008563 [Meloidogyne graminicola]|uniref:Uncharacterized protein n=1 Tax=Meloidogyne graminicola TaxID=189291 RepID=A0A8S9ZFB7_9BILA|nr:hypothetical protein Mgra_00008563 [Meloidogyne graminicola]